MSSFEHEGHRLAYTVHGDGEQTCVLLHGLLFTQRLHQRLAGSLSRRGHRVVTLDLLGHGASDRPSDMQAYSMSAFARQVVGLLDHLEIETAVVCGMSLGANTALEVAALAPERLQGMVIEMPVLDHALIGCALAFTPVMIAMTTGEPVMKVVQAVARRVPPLPWFADQLDRFLVMYGDTYLRVNYGAVAAAHARSGREALIRSVLRNRGRWGASNVNYARGRVRAYDNRTPPPGRSGSTTGCCP